MTESEKLPSYCVRCQCGDNVWLQLGDKYRACPRCGAPISELSSYEVDWDDNKKQFYAVIAFPIPKNSNDAHLLVARLPDLIARQSRCSCSSTLTLGSHSIKIIDGKVVLKGYFLCPRCAGEGRTATRKIRDAIGNIWNQIVKIRIGMEGIEIEKSPESKG